MVLNDMAGGHRREAASIRQPGIAASIEVSPKQALENRDLPTLFPKGTRVYITDIGTDATDTLVMAARHINELGHIAVPHVAARRLTTRFALEERVRASAQEAGVRDMLVIGGGLKKPAGEFASSMAALETGLFEKYGITDIGVAGHPEGSPDFSAEVALEALRQKQAFGERTGIRIRIVTQFGFDGSKFIAWADSLKDEGIDLPVHLGVAGPAKVTTLIRFAAECGVGNSLDFFKRNTGSLFGLATAHSPEGVVGSIEAHYQTAPSSPISQIHVFAFGGIRKAAAWLTERGSWAA